MSFCEVWVEERWGAAGAGVSVTLGFKTSLRRGSLSLFLKSLAELLLWPVGLRLFQKKLVAKNFHHHRQLNASKHTPLRNY